MLDRRDAHHEACAALLQDTRERRVVPAPVLPEVDHLTRRGGVAAAFTALVADIERGAITVEDLDRDDYRRVNELRSTYASADVGFVDAAVLAIVERLRETKLATLDRRHFGLMRPSHVTVLELLPA
jgi:predicted nucleic acid-binding protein